MVNRSVSNPAIRRRELMTRLRGFEDVANETGCVGEFYTITAPSRYHAVYSQRGFVFEWNGSSPRDTPRYLCRARARIRAALSREAIHVFGFHVVEPHHDGTPHWHMLLFMRPENVQRVQQIMRDQAYKEDSGELTTPQALKARFHAEPIDPEKGSATGYIAKYISKISTVTRWKARKMMKPAQICATWLRLFQYGLHAGVFASFSRLAVRL